MWTKQMMADEVEKLCNEIDAVEAEYMQLYRGLEIISEVVDEGDWTDSEMILQDLQAEIDNEKKLNLQQILENFKQRCIAKLE